MQLSYCTFSPQRARTEGRLVLHGERGCRLHQEEELGRERGGAQTAREITTDAVYVKTNRWHVLMLWRVGGRELALLPTTSCNLPWRGVSWYRQMTSDGEQILSCA